MVVDEGVMARRFWLKFKSESLLAMYTPFFVCLASGNLDSETFRHCISQDVHFLKAFAHAYELAEDCADDDDDKEAILKLRKRIVQKLKTHDSLVQEWGFEDSKENDPNEATVKITDFLVATASGRVDGEKVPGNILATPFEKTKLAAYTLAAIAPCMRLFVFISKEILAVLESEDSSHMYKKWIESYSSQHFEESALQTEELLDRLGASLTSQELEVIEKLYHQAMKLGVDYFCAQSIAQQTIVPLSRAQDSMGKHLTIFCDFDLACAAFDSSAILAELAIVTAPKADPDGSEAYLTRLSSANLRATWAELSTQYAEEYEHCIESIIPSESAENINYEGLSKGLEQLADFEKKANSRVVQSGVLRGLNLEDIKRAGQLLVLQCGCRGFFQNILRNGYMKTDVHILSYCWCGDLIRSAFSSGDLGALEVHSNELAYEESICTGEIIEKVTSTFEKLETFKHVRKGHGGDDNQLTVYIGGSAGDLLCLLEADIGIVIGSSPSLRRLGDHFGITYVPLFPGLVKKQKEVVELKGSCKWNRLSGILYTVSSWSEIQAFILGS